MTNVSTFQHNLLNKFAMKLGSNLADFQQKAASIDWLKRKASHSEYMSYMARRDAWFASCEVYESMQKASFALDQASQAQEQLSSADVAYYEAQDQASQTQKQTEEATERAFDAEVIESNQMQVIAKAKSNKETGEEHLKTEEKKAPNKASLREPENKTSVMKPFTFLMSLLNNNVNNKVIKNGKNPSEIKEEGVDHSGDGDKKGTGEKPSLDHNLQANKLQALNAQMIMANKTLAKMDVQMSTKMTQNSFSMSCSLLSEAFNQSGTQKDSQQYAMSETENQNVDQKQNVIDGHSLTLDQNERFKTFNDQNGKPDQKPNSNSYQCSSQSYSDNGGRVTSSADYSGSNDAVSANAADLSSIQDSQANIQEAQGQTSTQTTVESENKSENVSQISSEIQKEVSTIAETEDALYLAIKTKMTNLNLKETTTDKTLLHLITKESSNKIKQEATNIFTNSENIRNRANTMVDTSRAKEDMANASLYSARSDEDFAQSQLNIVNTTDIDLQTDMTSLVYKAQQFSQEENDDDGTDKKLKNKDQHNKL